MRGDTANKGWSRSQLSLEPPSSDHIHHINISDTTSSSSSPSAKRRSSSSILMMNINIDALPDVVLVEILCRLPCYKLVFQCSCVSKRWYTLISNPYFVRRFLHLQINKQTPSILINPNGEDIFTRMSSPVFKRLMTVRGLKREPVVVGTYNDLVLCCARESDQSDYYICNPNTSQWVALPPTPTKWQRPVPVGFICDIPYYNYKQDDDGSKGSDIVQLNPEYRCLVVRILPIDQYDENHGCFKSNLELFCSETGKWRESVVMGPISFRDLNPHFSFAYNGLLYWIVECSLPRLVVLDPFMINSINRTSTSSSHGDDVNDYYKCRVLKFDDPALGGDETLFSTIDCRGVCGGYIGMCSIDTNSRTVYVYELKEELERTREYSLDPYMIPHLDELEASLIAFDPNNEDILYLNIDGDVVKCNICTREWSKLAEFESNLNIYDCFFPIAFPQWPTPVPKLS